MRAWTIPSLAVALILSLAGCDASPLWELRSHEDEGEVCVTGGGAAPVDVSVTLDDCMSSSCSRDFDGSCSVTADGDRLIVRSEMSWEDAVAGVACTDDCMIPRVICTAPDLPDGTYTVEHGTETLTVTLPTVADCVGF